MTGMNATDGLLGRMVAAVDTSAVLSGLAAITIALPTR